MPKHKGNVHYSILKDEHIQWLVQRLHVDPNIIVETLHCQLNEAFNSQAQYLSVVYQRPFEVKLDLPSS